MPRPTKELVSCMPVQAGGALSGSGGPVAPGEGALSGCSVSQTSAPDPPLLSSPAFSRGPDAGTQIGFSFVRSASPHLDVPALSHFWALVSLKPVGFRVWSLHWLAEQHCHRLFFCLPDCPFPLHVHLLESCPSFRAQLQGHFLQEVPLAWSCPFDCPSTGSLSPSLIDGTARLLCALEAEGAFCTQQCLAQRTGSANAWCVLGHSG